MAFVNGYGFIELSALVLGIPHLALERGLLFVSG